MEVGVRFDTPQKLCRGEEECREQKILLELGKVYEVWVRVDPPVTDPSRLYNAIAQVRKKYPSVSINYVSISPDGKEITIQLFDPAYGMPGPLLEIIVIIALFIVALLAVKYTIEDMYIAVTHYIPEKPGETPEEKERFSKTFWYTILFCASAVSAGYFVRSLKK